MQNKESNTEMKPLWKEMIKAVRHEVVPAIGCTEPVSLALAAAIAAATLGMSVYEIEARVSANMMKNGMGVIVPGTGTAGLLIAAAVGAIGGNPDGKLEVLKNITPAHVDQAKQLIADGKVRIRVADVDHVLYSEVRVFHGTDSARVCIADAHTNVIRIEKNENVIFEAKPKQSVDRQKAYSLDGIRAQDIFEFAAQAPIEAISFIEAAAALNDALAETGMRQTYGLQIGRVLKQQIDIKQLSQSLLLRMTACTAAASDARMGGASQAAMTNSGSGNQGITATVPVTVAAKYLQADHDTTIRALMLSHMMAIYIHSKLPKLSALCAASTAAMGAAAGIAYLCTKDFKTVSMAISNMVGDIPGIICDGAAHSCSMKVTTSVMAAYKAVLMALQGIRVTGDEGIVSDDIDDSINNVGTLACEGMAETDKQILAIMMQKEAKQRC
ncbi:serine dehydratase subunit alpha family protein [Megasphaera cerevisiae]|jgi:L-cysteine desulfidase|uniref:L-cysteine desulfidase family protein n=1 Tax=Megasphaera cerevisiae TaxID=39029 RepID=UPI0009F89859|nr:L-serine ammonia-lyase, iron-sulfur-dependent, subunit alpha [Megasphaera cerevisiae]